ncbi:MAG: TRAM domain-containing protein, partial [Nitrospirota bacterium]|nr:TRAM domain-containing protein [Nitrospirota bacterium]
MSTFTIRIEQPVYGGLSMGRHEGKVVMIRGAVLPGETVEVTLDREKKDYLTASAIKVLEPSPLRIEPACGYFGSCGGCHLQHAPYDLQVQMKEGLLTDCLKRMAKTDIALSSPIINDSPWNYRSRGQFKVSGGETGFYRENTRELVSIDECRLMRPEINAYLQKAKPLLKQTGIRELHITHGDRAAALIRTGARSNARADLDRTAAMFLDAGFSGIFIETGNNKTLKYGSPYADLEFEGLRYTVSPASFFQSNWRLNLCVAKTIKEALGPLKDRRVLDLYAGAGNLSLLLAGEAEITAVEENPDSISD